MNSNIYYVFRSIDEIDAILKFSYASLLIILIINFIIYMIILYALPLWKIISSNKKIKKNTDNKKNLLKQILIQKEIENEIENELKNINYKS